MGFLVNENSKGCVACYLWMYRGCHIGYETVYLCIEDRRLIVDLRSPMMTEVESVQ
jgi:hypothetical protein